MARLSFILSFLNLFPHELWLKLDSQQKEQSGKREREIFPQILGIRTKPEGGRRAALFVFPRQHFIN